MGLTDLLLAGGLIGGSLYLLYRSLWKKKGYCPGCTGESCPAKKEQEND